MPGHLPPGPELREGEAARWKTEGGLSLTGQGMARRNVLGASETLEAEGTGVMRSEARDTSPARPPGDCDPGVASGTGRRPLHPGVPPSWRLGLCPCVSPWLACGGTWHVAAMRLPEAAHSPGLDGRRRAPAGHWPVLWRRHLGLFQHLRQKAVKPSGRAGCRTLLRHPLGDFLSKTSLMKEILVSVQEARGLQLAEDRGCSERPRPSPRRTLACCSQPLLAWVTEEAWRGPWALPGSTVAPHIGTPGLSQAGRLDAPRAWCVSPPCPRSLPARAPRTPREEHPGAALPPGARGQREEDVDAAPEHRHR